MCTKARGVGLSAGRSIGFLVEKHAIIANLEIRAGDRPKKNRRRRRQMGDRPENRRR